MPKIIKNSGIYEFGTHYKLLSLITDIHKRHNFKMQHLITVNCLAITKYLAIFGAVIAKEGQVHFLPKICQSGVLT